MCHSSDVDLTSSTWLSLNGYQISRILRWFLRKCRVLWKRLVHWRCLHSSFINSLNSNQSGKMILIDGHQHLRGWCDGVSIPTHSNRTQRCVWLAAFLTFACGMWSSCESVCASDPIQWGYCNSLGRVYHLTSCTRTLRFSHVWLPWACWSLGSRC